MVARKHYFRKRVGRIHMAKDGYKFVRDRRNVTFLNTAISHFLYINQRLTVCSRNTGSVEVNGSTPLGPPFIRSAMTYIVHQALHLRGFLCL